MEVRIRVIRDVQAGAGMWCFSRCCSACSSACWGGAVFSGGGADVLVVVVEGSAIVFVCSLGVVLGVGRCICR